MKKKNIDKAGNHHPDKELASSLYQEKLRDMVADRTARLEDEIRRHKKTLVDLMDGNEKWRNLIDVSRDRIWELDSHGRYSFSSPHITDLLGLHPEEVMEKKPSDFTPEGEKETIDAFFADLLKHQKSFALVRSTYLHKDGSLVVVESSGIPMFASDGQFKGYRGIDRNITHRLLADDKISQMLRLQEVINSVLGVALESISIDEQLKKILHIVLSLSFADMLSAGAIFLVEEDQRTLGMRASHGLSAKQREVCARVPFGTCVCGRAAETRQILETDCKSDFHEISLKDALPHGHYCVPIKSGEKILGVMNLYLSVEHKHDKEEVLFLEAIAKTIAAIIERDIADKEGQRLQAQLAYAKRMEFSSRLAGGIAHDFNNILTAISGYTQLTIMELAKDDPLRENLEIINNSSRRAADLVRKLLTFSSMQKVSTERLNLNDVLKKQEKGILNLVGVGIELEIELGEDLWPINADYVQMEHVISNITLNAIESMPESGKLTVRTRNVFLGQDYAKAHHGVKPGEYVLLDIVDTGCGMDPEVREHIFEPFFTTKTEKGNGLGLATVYGIIKQNNGNIYVFSESGAGTVFRVFLPRATVDEQLGTEDRESREGTQGGTETVLVVEDEADVRAYLVRALADSGYKVIAAENGFKALDLAQAMGGSIDLLLTDVVMPGMNGTELAPKMRDIHPDIKVLYISGYAETAKTFKEILKEDINFLSKPVAPQDLVKSVRMLLDVSTLQKKGFGGRV